MKKDVALEAVGVISALGRGTDEVYRNLMRGEAPGMQHGADFSPSAPCYTGRVLAELPALPDHLRCFDSRNNRLLREALTQIQPRVQGAIERYGAARIGIVLGTSTGGVAVAEDAMRAHGGGAWPAGYDYRQQWIASGSDFLRALLATEGPALTISTACSSSAHALASARNLLRLGICDAVIAGGADTLCGLTVRGFQALESVSRGISNPLSVNRDGINVGEAAALFLMTSRPSPIRLLGSGASSDAHHISAPDPTGAGALTAMRMSLDDAGLTPDAVDYINLHGTGTVLNDAMETRAIRELFGADIVATSTKPYTGHTLGTAGALELAICWMLLSDMNIAGATPPHRWDGHADPALPMPKLLRATAQPLKTCLSNSFAFGGNNASLVIGRAV